MPRLTLSPFRFLVAFACAILGGALPAPAADAPPAAAKDAPRYPVRGMIVATFPEKSTLLLKNEKIPGILDAGTMAFRVEDPSIFKSLKKNQTVTATVIVRDDDFYLENIQVEKH